MSSHKLPPIEVGFQVFTTDRLEEFGAVREVVPNGRPEIVIYVENAGEFIIPLDAIARVAEQKVILDGEKIDPGLRSAIQHAHDGEQPGF